MKNLVNAASDFIRTPKGKVIAISAAVVLVGAITTASVFLSRHSAAVAPAAASETSSYNVSPIVSAESVSIDKTSLSLNVGDTIALKAKVLPENAANTQVSWSSSDKTIVSVVDGGLVAQQSGEAQVSATACNGVKAVCTVVVKAKPGDTATSSAAPNGGNNAQVSNGKTGSSAKTSGQSNSGKTSTTQPNNNQSSGNHVPLPTAQAEHYKTIGGNSLNLNTTAHGIQIQVDLTNAQPYVAQSDDPLPLNVKVYENGVLNSKMSGNYGDVGDEKTDPVCFNVDCYYKYGYYWTKPASYRVDIYVGNHKFETISFSVNENGFTS